MLTRRGSMVLFCLGLTTVLVVIAFGFLRASRLDLTAADTSTKMNLAQSAARMGLTHAMEQIAIEQDTADLQLAVGGTPTAFLWQVSSMGGRKPPTFLDGPYRSSFQSMSLPQQLLWVDLNTVGSPTAADDGDDTRAENVLVAPMLGAGHFSGNGYFNWYTPVDNLTTVARYMSEGRGRIIEPDFVNTTRQNPISIDPILNTPAATRTVRFTDRTPAIPERSGALFLDSRFRRIKTGTAIDQRLSARYRLRYSVGVEDLNGHLLSNPIGCHSPNDIVIGNNQTMVWPQDSVWNSGSAFVGSWRNPSAPYRTPPQWLTGAANAWYNMTTHASMVKGGEGNGPTLCGLAAEHVFIGRGPATAADRNPTDGFPSAFPYMTRNTIVSGANREWWGYWPRFGKSTNVMIPNGLYPGTTQAGGQYLSFDGIPASTLSSTPLVVGGTGPQLSWFSNHFSTLGIPNQQNLDTGYYNNMFLTTPYGQRLVASTKPAAQWKWYEGRVDSPWYVNLLTAAPATIDAMIAAYIPSGTVLFFFVSEQYTTHTQSVNAQGEVTHTWTPIPSSSYTFPTRIGVGFTSRDLFTQQTNAAFPYYSAPVSASLNPDYLKLDDRPNKDRYPGSLWWDNKDELGDLIDVNYATNANQIGICSKTGQAFYAYTRQSRNGTFIGGGFRNPTPPATFMDDPDGLDGWSWTPETATNSFNGSGEFKALDTYYADIICAFTQSIAIARAAWVQYPSRAFAPSSSTITPSLRNPTAYDTLEEIDKLFLRQLGEDFDTPGNGPVATVHLSGQNDQSYLDDAHYTPNYNLKTMAAKWLTGVTAAAATATTPEILGVAPLPDAMDRANTMEKVLNDWRMSFLGASPQYSETFRPLDFTGDGKVHCSAYDMNPLASTSDAEKGIAWWKVADASGRGPAPDHYFSLTGCLFIGKSHYFRVISRGEVFDNVVQKPINDATLESVIAADPEGTDPHNLRVLFQRWHYNNYTGMQPQQLE